MDLYQTWPHDCPVEGKNPIYFGVIRSKVKITVTINGIFYRLIIYIDGRILWCTHFLLSSENQDTATSSCTSETNEDTVSPHRAIRTSADNATARMTPLTNKVQPNDLDLAFHKPNVDDPQKMLLLKNNWSIPPSFVSRSPATI